MWGLDLRVSGSLLLPARLARSSHSMGIPGEYDNPRIEEAFDRVSAAARKVSVDGRLLSVGFGGLQ